MCSLTSFSHIETQFVHGLSSIFSSSSANMENTARCSQIRRQIYGRLNKYKCLDEQRGNIRINLIVDKEHNAVTNVFWSPIKETTAGSER